jgi:hypothetical protein
MVLTTISLAVHVKDSPKTLSTIYCCIKMVDRTWIETEKIEVFGEEKL